MENPRRVLQHNQGLDSLAWPGDGPPSLKSVLNLKEEER